LIFSILNHIENTLQFFLKRGIRFLRQSICSVLHSGYIKFVVVPYLHRKENLGKEYSIKPAFNTVVISDSLNLHKIALSKTSTIGLEYANYELIRNRYPDLLKIIPDYRAKKKSFIYYLSMQRYKSANLNTSLSYAIKLYQVMRTYGTEDHQLKFSDSNTLQAGLNVIQKIYGVTAEKHIFQIVDTFLARRKYHIGFTHGDYHSRNILSGNDGKPILIDLDCVRFQDIQELDALSFVLEMEWSRSGRLWYMTLANYFMDVIPDNARNVLSRFGVTYNNGLGVTYFVDRIGQETLNYGIEYSRALLDASIEMILSNQTKLN